jgi:hypothetical protein
MMCKQESKRSLPQAHKIPRVEEHGFLLLVGRAAHQLSLQQSQVRAPLILWLGEAV